MPKRVERSAEAKADPLLGALATEGNGPRLVSCAMSGRNCLYAKEGREGRGFKGRSEERKEKKVMQLSTLVKEVKRRRRASFPQIQKGGRGREHG